MAEGLSEGERARKKPLLEQHRDDVAPRLGAVELGAFREDLVEQLEHRSFVFARDEGQSADHPVLEPLVGKVALEAADRNVLERVRVEQRSTREPA